MQKSFLDEDYKLQQKYRRYLTNLDCQGALQILGRWGKTVNPGNLPDKVKAIAELDERLSTLPPGDVEATAELMLGLPTLSSSALAEDLRDIQRGFMKRIADICSDRDLFGYIRPQLHPAEIFIGIQRYDEAIKTVRKYVEKHGEKPVLRQMQSYAFFEEGEERAGYRCLSYALFNNPLMCLERFPFLKTPLLHKAVTPVFCRLKEEVGNAASAWIRLPLMLWEEGKITINAESPAFEEHLRKAVESATPSEDNPPENKVLFLRLLYLAETCPRTNEQNIQYREAMKKADGQLFEFYKQVISRRSDGVTGALPHH